MSQFVIKNIVAEAAGEECLVEPDALHNVLLNLPASIYIDLYRRMQAQMGDAAPRAETSSSFSDSDRGCDEQQEEQELSEGGNANHDVNQEQQGTPADHAKKRRKVDIGKIMALHNAGWSNTKIADEMHLHPITVGKYIKARRENGKEDGTGDSADDAEESK